jgi:glycosyltransferase involved in cell wall biosynthesis
MLADTQSTNGFSDLVRPEVSFVVIDHNEDPVIIDCISPIIAQEGGAPYEIIVVDDGSTDCTASLIMKIAAIQPQITLIRHLKNRGRGAARCSGIAAVRAELVAMVDAGCVPEEGWLVRLIASLVSGSERMMCGPSWVGNNLLSPERGAPTPEYLDQAATINLAFIRDVVEEAGEFDETLNYGSDLDFARRVSASGIKIRYLAKAVVDHDWGTFRRQLKHSRQYGAARIRLSLKHSNSVLDLGRSKPTSVLYSLFNLGLPLTLRFRIYLLLLAIPLWRARKRPYPLRVVACHFAEGVGSLHEIADTTLRAPQDPTELR